MSQLIKNLSFTLEGLCPDSCLLKNFIHFNRGLHLSRTVKEKGCGCGVCNGEKMRLVGSLYRLADKARCARVQLRAD